MSNSTNNGRPNPDQIEALLAELSVALRTAKETCAELEKLAGAGPVLPSYGPKGKSWDGLVTDLIAWQWTLDMIECTLSSEFTPTFHEALQNAGLEDPPFFGNAADDDDMDDGDEDAGEAWKQTAREPDDFEQWQEPNRPHCPVGIRFLGPQALSFAEIVEPSAN